MLILAALTCQEGFARDIYRRFAGSLAATGFDGDIIIMTTCEEIHNRDLLNLQDEYGCVTFHTIAGQEDDRDINCYRYRHFYQYLRSQAVDYGYIMLSDARDVIFQRDISKYPFDPATDLFFAEEEKLIGDCPINAGWILDLYGQACLSELKNRTVLCSGTTFGLPLAVLQYLEVMIEQVDRVDDEFHGRFGYLGGIVRDQITLKRWVERQASLAGKCQSRCHTWHGAEYRHEQRRLQRLCYQNAVVVK